MWRKLLPVLFLLSCDTQQHLTGGPVELKSIPKFEDCVYVRFDPGGQHPFTNAVRCPGSVVTTDNGKAGVTVVTSSPQPQPATKIFLCQRLSGAAYNCEEVQMIPR